jgi:hypothetical protein
MKETDSPAHSLLEELLSATLHVEEMRSAVWLDDKNGEKSANTFAEACSRRDRARKAVLIMMDPRLT